MGFSGHDRKENPIFFSRVSFPPQFHAHSFGAGAVQKRSQKVQDGKGHCAIPIQQTAAEKPYSENRRLSRETSKRKRRKVDDALICFRCKVVLESPVKPISFVIKLIATLSLAPLHGGMWVWEEFSSPYCRRCRLKISVFAVLLGMIVFTAAMMMFRWVIKEGLLRF